MWRMWTTNWSACYFEKKLVWISLTIECSVNNLENIYRSDYKLPLSFTMISVVYRSFIPNKTYIYQVLFYSMDFKAPRELLNPRVVAVSSIFHGFGGQSKLYTRPGQFSPVSDMAHFHTFNTDKMYVNSLPKTNMQYWGIISNANTCIHF